MRALVAAAFAALAVAVCTGWARGVEPQAPKLDGVIPPAAEADRGRPARALPRTLAICIDRASRRCWSGERAADCSAENGAVFAMIPLEGGEPGALLRSCWDELR